MLNKIKVGGLIYDVVPVQWEENADGDLQFGIFNANKTNILINELISEQVQKQTLIHEMMHAIFFEAGIEVENEEYLVNRISAVLYQVLQDNDFSFMKDEEEKASFISEIKPIDISANEITGGNIAQFVRDSGNIINANQEKTDESKVYVENGKIGTKVDPMLLDTFRAIDELSSRLDALDSKINLKPDSKELDELIKDIY